MRWLIPLALVFTGCSDIVCGLGTVQDGARCMPAIGGGIGDLEDTAAPEGPHPLVPEEYTWIWNTKACEKENGKSGNQVYILADGRVEADGSLTITEQWFWFWKEPGWEGDCVDTIEISADPMTQNMGSMGCQPCDEGFEGRRNVVVNNCDVNYKYRFVSARRPDDKVSYPVILMFDTLTPSDTPNVDQKMLVFAINADNDGEFSGSDVQKDYAEGHIFPDDADNHYGYPADYDWVGSRCY